MFNLNLFLATVIASLAGCVGAYLAGNVFAGITALGVGAASYWLVILIEQIRKWVWFRK